MLGFMLQDTPPISNRSPSVRSKLANGSKLLPLTDGRSATARRFRDLYEDICRDLGGVARLSEGQRQMVRRAAMISAECERMEAMAARGEAEFHVDTYGSLCDRLGRVFQRIGLRRVASVTPSLRDYLAAKPVPLEIDNDEADA
jgi:hypothetical protein